MFVTFLQKLEIVRTRVLTFFSDLWVSGRLVANTEKKFGKNEKKTEKQKGWLKSDSMSH